MRLLTLSTILCFVLLSCNSKKEKENSSDISQDSLVKLRMYIHDTILINAQNLVKSGKTVSILKTVTRMYETDTNNLDYALDLSTVLIAASKTKDALRLLDLSLIKDKRYSSKIYYTKSLAWGFILNKDSSYYYLGKAIAIDSFNVKYLVHRSRKYEEDSLLHKALVDINKAIKIQPANKGLYVYRGIYKKELGNYKEALIDMQEIPTFMQKEANVFTNRAFVYMKLGMFKECIEDCNKSILLSPNNSETYGIRANAKSNLKDFTGAYDDLKKAVKLGSKEAIPLYEQYKSYFETKEI